MKVITRLVVAVSCFIVVNTVLAQGERYELVIAVSVEPETSDKDKIYIDRLITDVDQEASASNQPVDPSQDNYPDRSDSAAGNGLPVNEPKPYIYMKYTPEGQGPR